MAELSNPRLGHLRALVRVSAHFLRVITSSFIITKPTSTNIRSLSAIIVITTIYLLLTTSPSPVPNQPLPPRLSSWATLLGVSSAMLAAIQYMPQIIHTYRMKLVGALSIAMMMIQSPGAVLMVLSIALRPDTNWTSEWRLV